MAWISVHEQVVGGKLRTLAKELNCSQNEALGMLVTLWLWGINNADSEGKIIGATRADIAKVLYVGLNEEIDPLKAVDALITTGWIDLDTDLYLHDWGEWQEQWYKAMTAREKDKERKRRERAAKKLAPQQKAPPVKRRSLLSAHRNLQFLNSRKLKVRLRDIRKISRSGGACILVKLEKAMPTRNTRQG